jgi:hypothetical protein
MRKLLIILLLLFPFHGAWAESKILICQYESGKVAFKLDLVKKNFHPEPPSQDSHQKNTMLIEDDENYMFSYEYGHNPKDDYFLRRMIIINRYSGKFRDSFATYSISTRKIIKDYSDSGWDGTCELNKKKKF